MNKANGRSKLPQMTKHCVFFFALLLAATDAVQAQTGKIGLAKPMVAKSCPFAQPLTQKSRQHIEQFREASKKPIHITGEKAEVVLKEFYSGFFKQAGVKPDLVVEYVRACRSPRGDGYVDWTITVGVMNQGGGDGITSQFMPLTLYVDFDPNMPYGQGTVGPADVEPTINFNKDEAWMQVPTEPGGHRTWVFNETYPDWGPCQRPCYRMVPTNFYLFVDQMVSGYPGPIAESNELNNGNGVTITGHDTVNGYTGVPQWCWASQIPP